MKKAIIEKILANSALFTKEALEAMDDAQLARLADYLVPKK